MQTKARENKMTLTLPTLANLPAIVFQFSSNKVTLLNKDLAIYPGLTPAKLTKVVRGDWRKLVPEEFHPVVLKLGALLKKESHTTVEFPVYWMGNTVWLRVFATSVQQPRGHKKIFGLVQDVTIQRQSGSEPDIFPDHLHEEDEFVWRKLRHDVNSSLTSIFMNCELLLDNSFDAGPRQRVGAVLAEALRIDQFLQQYRR